MSVGSLAWKQANADAYRTVFFSNIAFSGVAIVCSLLLPDVDHLLTAQVATTLHRVRVEEVEDGQEKRSERLAVCSN